MLSNRFRVALYTSVFTAQKLTWKYSIGFDNNYINFIRVLNAITMFTYCISKLNKPVKLLLALLQTHHTKNWP